VKNTVKKSLLCLSMVSTLGVVAFTSASTEVMAQDAGFFVSGQVGSSRYDDDLLGKKRATGVGVGVGYNLNQTVAVELAYHDYGTAKFGGIDAKAKSTQFAVLLSAPIANEFSVYGRLGVASTDRQLRVFGGSGSDRKTEGVLGVGLGYNFAKNIKGTLEYQKVGSNSGDGTGVDAVNIGVKFGF
jgi:OmpA-OmpF porin, OOP family